MVRVFRYLADNDGSAESNAIRDGVPGYGGDSGHRQWRRDLAELRRRGLVIVEDPAPGVCSRIALARLKKPDHLFLTFGEHDVLAEVEDRLRNSCTAPSPLPEGRAREVDEFARLGRYLEERPGQELTYADVGRALGLRRERLTKLLEQIAVESEIDEYVSGAPEHPALAWIEFWSPEAEPPDGYICNIDNAAVLSAAMAETFDSRKRTGQLGFWAYSAAETDDRLRLIYQALAELDLTPAQRDRLESAEAKLREWKTLLPPG